MRTRIRTSPILPALLVLATTLAYLPAQREGSGPAPRAGAAADEAQPKLALKGLDPVLLAKGEKKEGKSNLTATHEGFLYQFASAETRSAFLAAPQQHAVQDRGLCPVAKVMMNREVPGDPEIFSVHNQQIYFLTNTEAKKMFDEDPSKYTPQRKREGS